MTAAGELAALRGVARNLSTTTAPVDPRRAHAWGSVLSTSARNLARAIEFLRAQVEERHPEVDPAEGDAGYEGLNATQAAARFASIAARAAIEGAPATQLAEEMSRFASAVDLIASPPPPSGRGVAATSPGANGVGRARRGARATSTNAALLALANSGTNRRKVLDAVAQVARDPKLVGLTDLQLAQATGLRENSVRPRRVELVDGGWLEPAENTREHYGREHTVWCLTQKAVGELFAGTRA